MIFLFTLFKNKDSLSNFNALCWRICKGFKLLNSFYFKAIYCICCPLHCWDSFCQLNVCSCFLGFSLICKLFGFCGLNTCNICFLLSISTFSCDYINQLSCFFFFNSYINHSNFQSLLKTSNLFISLLHCHKTSFKSINLICNFTSFFSKELFVEIN